jgi:FAD/FMN-containing dehydrogenase
MTSMPRPDLLIPQLHAALNGRVVAPDDPAYDQARAVFFRGFDRRPAAIVRATDATDVARVVSLARETGLGLAVRSGGHSNAGYGTSDGGIVLDLSQMRALDIDVEGRSAWAETGLTAGAYTAAAAARGLATGFGDTGSVGLGGNNARRRRRIPRPQARPHDRRPAGRRVGDRRRPAAEG